LETRAFEEAVAGSGDGKGELRIEKEVGFDFGYLAGGMNCSRRVVAVVAAAGPLGQAPANHLSKPSAAGFLLLGV
jgi:hypothetical protein